MPRWYPHLTLNVNLKYWFSWKLPKKIYTCKKEMEFLDLNSSVFWNIFGVCFGCPLFLFCPFFSTCTVKFYHLNHSIYLFRYYVALTLIINGYFFYHCFFCVCSIPNLFSDSPSSHMYRFSGFFICDLWQLKPLSPIDFCLLLIWSTSGDFVGSH